MMEMKKGSIKLGTDTKEDGLGMLKHRSLDLQKHQENGGFIRKTKSLGNQFYINVDELVRNVSGSFSESGSPAIRPCTNWLNFPMMLHEVSISSEQNSDDAGAEHLENGSSHDYSPHSRWLIDEPAARSLPICLSFQDVMYKVPATGEKNVTDEGYILQGISGSANPGELLALIGPSGGGKTTLLNLLSGRVKFNGGNITYNDQPYSKSLKHKIGFVLQDDVTFPHLTVKETLTYAALLRLPSTMTREQKNDRAMNVILDLGLERCQNTVIGGGHVKGISGGERKRVCIGNEILLNPSLLFLDEPTSSLDSGTALKIVQLLHNMAKGGKTVVTTIHQPSSRSFNKFDKLILLGKGNSLYFGKASEAMKYFSSIGCSPLVAMNPAEFLIDLANGNMNDKSIPCELEDKFSQQWKKNEVTDTSKRPTSVEVHEYLVEAHETRSCKMRTKRKLLKPVFKQDKHNAVARRSSSRDWGASWWDQFCILLNRGLKERRHEHFSGIRVIQVISTAIIMGLLWWNPKASSVKDFQDQAGLLFFCSVFWAFFPLFTAIFTFPQERAMLLKERSTGMYKLSAYFAARNVTDLPLELILPIVFMLIVYFMVGLKPSVVAFSLTLFTIFFSIVAAQGLGLSIGAAFTDVKKAMTLASVIIMSFMLAGGFFIQDVPSFMSWIRYISFNYHTYRLLLRIQSGCSDYTVTNSDGCEVPVIKGIRIDYSGKEEVGALLLMIVGYRLLAYMFLKRMKVRT